MQTPGWNPLVDRLLARGRAHRRTALGLGLDLDDAGRPRDADGAVREGIHVLGAARKGLEWEVTAIPDLRAQAVAARRPPGAHHQTPNSSPPSRTMNADTTTMKNTRTKRRPAATAVRAPR